MFTIYGKDSKEDSLFAGGCDFVLELGEERKGTEIRLLQLTDMQVIDAGQCRTENRLRLDEKAAWTRENVEQQCYAHIRSLVAQTKPDMIFITGDVVYGEFDDSGESLRDFIRFMDAFRIPWTLVFGNHDNEAAIGVERQCELYASSRYCMFRRGKYPETAILQLALLAAES